MADTVRKGAVESRKCLHSPYLLGKTPLTHSLSAGPDTPKKKTQTLWKLWKLWNFFQKVLQMGVSKNNGTPKSSI